MKSFVRSAGISRRRWLQTAAAAAAWPLGAASAAEPPADLVAPIGPRLKALEEAAALTMRFHGGTADEARRWQNRFAAKLRRLLGPTEPPTEWECVVEKTVELPNHVREERVLTAKGAAPVPFHLLLPKDLPQDAGARRPGILALHGHGLFGHDSIAGIDDTPERRAEIDKYKYDYGLKLVERGYVVAAPCLTPFGRRRGDYDPKRGDPCTLVNLQLQHVGKLLIAENIRDALWMLEFLAKHAAVDAGRLACVGLSYGGRIGTFVTALDLRIQAGVFGGAMNTFQDRAVLGSTAGCQVVPGLLNFGDVPEVAGLIAPRTCLWTVGENDRLLDPEWTEKFRERQARVYAALDASPELAVDRFAGGHEWHGDVAYPLLEHALYDEEVLVDDALQTSVASNWHLNHGQWQIVEAGFRGIENSAENHGAAARYRVERMFTDAVLEFEVRLDGAKAASLSVNDLSRHLCTVRIRPNGLQIMKDDTDARGPDKTEIVATVKGAIGPGVWHRLKVSFAGDVVTAELGELRAVGKHAQFAEPRENFAFVVAGDSASFRKLRVTVPALPKPARSTSSARAAPTKFE